MDNVPPGQPLHESPGPDQRYRVHPHPSLGVQNPLSYVNYQYFVLKYVNTRSSFQDLLVTKPMVKGELEIREIENLRIIKFGNI
jgi:hypothetical protein